MSGACGHGHEGDEGVASVSSSRYRALTGCTKYDGAGMER